MSERLILEMKEMIREMVKGIFNKSDEQMVEQLYNCYICKNQVIENSIGDDTIYKTYDYILHQLKLMQNNQDLEDDYVPFENPIYDRYRDIERNTDELIENPLEVRSSYNICNKCKSDKVIGGETITRSIDEGCTAVLNCTKCNNVWRQYA